MKILAIHSDFIEFQAKKKAFKAAEENINPDLQRVEECLVIFTAAEKPDENNEKVILEKYLHEIKSIATQVKAQKIVIYPYAHLSSNLASPKFAEKIMKDAEEQLKKEKSYEVFRAPFGWYKSFNVACKGHPLSELSRNITADAKYVGIVKEEHKFEQSDKELSNNEKQAASMALVMVKAVKEIYPKAQFGGFDFHLGEAYADFGSLKIKRGELNKISKKMQELLKQDLKFEAVKEVQGQFNKEIAKDEATLKLIVEFLKSQDLPPYKKLADLLKQRLAKFY